MKQIVFLKHLSLFETATDKVDTKLDENNLKALFDDLQGVYQKHGIRLKSYEVARFPMDKLSIQYCQECGQLMIDRDANPMKFAGSEYFADQNQICLDGGMYNGKKLCEECLPVSHRWGHFS